MMIVDGAYVSCPKCGWEPSEGDTWVCDVCRTKWNTFDTHGKCPGCGKQFIDTQCSRSKGCGQLSLNEEWYSPAKVAEEKPKKLIWFWQKSDEAPVTENDRMWVESELLYLTELFTPEFFKSLVTITPDRQYFDRDFSGTEKDADYILQKVAEIMYIKPWEIQLMFFSNNPTQFSEGVTATPSEKLHGGWTSKNSGLVNKGFGQKEIWIDLRQLNDPVALIATMSVELAKYKLTSEYEIEKEVWVLADIASLVFGFGIFRANAYFKFGQWQGNSHQGWSMSARGGLPEPVIAYVMAWLAHYRSEDTSWKQYLNRTVRRYFEQSDQYIQKNAAQMKWSL